MAKKTLLRVTGFNKVGKTVRSFKPSDSDAMILSVMRNLGIPRESAKVVLEAARRAA